MPGQVHIAYSPIDNMNLDTSRIILMQKVLPIVN